MLRGGVKRSLADIWRRTRLRNSDGGMGLSAEFTVLASPFCKVILLQHLFRDALEIAIPSSAGTLLHCAPFEVAKE